MARGQPISCLSQQKTPYGSSGIKKLREDADTVLFNSIDFMLFFPAVVIVYFFIPKKARYIWLLVSSYYFYMGWNPKYALLIALSTLITYTSSILIFKYKERVLLKRICLWGSLISNLGILTLFKYANFILSNLSLIISKLGFAMIDKRLDLLLPVGISFYTFQALSYTLDVYKGRINPERNILRYGLYVSFFPQLVAGPIERAANLLPQIQNIENIRVWNYKRVRDGVLLMFWGLFQKLVIADRAAMIVDPIIHNYSEYGFFELSVAVILFAFQIYGDFGGYTNIARGAAKVMGFELMNNFEQPYFATSIKDFWRRWHISLTTWFTDYLYIPLGGNRRGIARKYLNILIVFGVSGLWHGASWNFIAWGLLHALFQIAGDFKYSLSKGTGGAREQGLRTVEKIRKTVATFLLVDFAWIFFVCSSFTHAINVIKQMLSCAYKIGLGQLGFSLLSWFSLFFGLSALFIVDFIHEKSNSVNAILSRQKTWVRWLVYLLLFWSIVIFGVWGKGYDVGNFIYFQF